MVGISRKLSLPPPWLCCQYSRSFWALISVVTVTVVHMGEQYNVSENFCLTIIFVSSSLSKRYRYDLANVSYLLNYCEPNWKFRSSFACGKFLISLRGMMTPTPACSLSLLSPPSLWPSLTPSHRLTPSKKCIPTNIYCCSQNILFGHLFVYILSGSRLNRPEISFGFSPADKFH